MFLLFTILSKLMLVICGMMIDTWIEWGYTHLILIGIIISITLHFICLFMAKYYKRSNSNVHIRELQYGDDKPDGMSDEVWEKVQDLLRATECPDKLEPSDSKDYEDEP